MNNRAQFIQQAGLLSLGVLMGNSLFAETSKTKKVGLQLWSVKEEMAANPWTTLEKLAGYGYNQLESFEGDKGIFWGKSNKEFRKFLAGLDMKLISSHCKVEEKFEQKAALAGEIGMKYLICPMKGPQKSIDDFKRFADEFNACGEICRKNGLRFAYHNHDYSFKEVDKQIPQDVLLNNTDKNLVDFEMDIYWAITAGVKPLEYMEKYPGRFRLAHIKDRSKNVPADAQWESCNLGKGVIDYYRILGQVKQEALKYLFVEQEKFTGSTPMKSAAENAAYIKGLL
jgi:sugar phosphate isomerase/epimerase